MSMSRITKRKLDDAIEKLDNVLVPSNDAHPPSPTKRPNTSRTSSIYASLSKYTLFRSKASSSPRSTNPARTISLPYALSSKPPYRPDSTSDFLTRLATYKVTTYRDKQVELNAVAAAKAGWTNEGKERLVCGYCSSSWVLASTTGMNQDAANTLAEKQRVGLVANHKEICPWKKAQCDDSVYRVPMKAPTALAKDIIVRATALSRQVDGLVLQHPLTSKEVATLKETISLVVLADAQKTKSSASVAQATESVELVADQDAGVDQGPDPPPEPALLLAVFGWDATPFIPLTPPSPAVSSISRASSPSPASRGATPSPLSHSGSLAHRHSLSLSRASGQSFSAAARAQHRQSMPSSGTVPDASAAKPASVRTLSGGSASLAESYRGSTKRNTSGGSTSLSGVPEGPGVNSIVHCQLCLRRVGLWSFQPNGSSLTVAEPSSTSEETPSMRSLDLVKEHRTYCPYVTKSAVVPAPVFSEPIGHTSLGRTSSVGSSHSLRKSLSTSLSHALSSGNGSKGRQSLDGVTPMEGWRATLTVISRSGLGMRFRRTGSTSQTVSAMKDGRSKDGRPPVTRSASVSFAVPEHATPSGEATTPPDARMSSPRHNAMDVDGHSSKGSDAGMEVDETEAENVNVGVERIVENVKKTKDGSRELLKYVKDLLRRGDPTPPIPSSSSAHASSRTSLCLNVKRTHTLTPPRTVSPSPGAAV